MKYVLIVLLVASIAGVEIFHALDDRAADANVCLAPEGKAEKVREVVLGHLRGH